ncbi:MAG: class I SAM-dependent methyltransferase, partial [Saprospiraceae bacterium]|nr:class I SAM-dependent methyltransferase [Saprospiraceae bacterium]
MLTKREKSELRSILFRHLDGIVTAPSAYELYDKGVLDYILKHKNVSLSSLAAEFNANEGYLNVALHTMASQGWLDIRVDNSSNTVEISSNELSEKAFKNCDLYKDVVELLKFSGNFHNRKFELEPFRKWELICKQYSNHFGKDNSDPLIQQIMSHIEGILIGPSIVALGMSGMFHKYFMEASFRPEEFHRDAESFEKLLSFFKDLGWFEQSGSTFKFTDKGLFFAKRASAYGVTVSYIPTLRWLNELIFGDPTQIRNIKPGEKEIHVDREMNVWGSGGAHAAYFKKVDEILIEIFNKPLAEQPKGVLDMGCGNGAFLEHIFNVIDGQTLRGEHLEDHPLFLVGADYNTTAIEISRRNLINADIWAKVIWGDISNPNQLAETLDKDYGIDLSDLLNVRTFLDHNRVFEMPSDNHGIASTSQGAFAHKGARIDNNTVEASLYEHLTLWKPFVSKHGLLLIE